jgi:hypothetical protein
MKVLVGCETSGKVRNAFARRGHTALSVDLLPPDDDDWHIHGTHIQGDVRDFLDWGWDLAIFHPPCTRLCNSGVRWLHERDLWAEMREACDLFLACLNAPIPRIAVENPVMHKHAREIIGRGPDFTIQPWQFGHGETKRTCFWTRNLSPLVPTNIVEGREARIHKMTPGPDRWKKRSETYQGIADAMAEQWGNLIEGRKAA